jgi:hypothetical protein
VWCVGSVGMTQLPVEQWVRECERSARVSVARRDVPRRRVSQWVFGLAAVVVLIAVGYMVIFGAVGLVH